MRYGNGKPSNVGAERLAGVSERGVCGRGFRLSRQEIPPAELGDLEFCGHLSSALETELDSATEVQPFVAESVGKALSAYVASRFSANPPKCGGLDSLRLERITEYIRVHLSNGLSLEELASVACLSAFHLCRMFKISTGETLHQYVTRTRIERSKKLLMQNKFTVAEIAAAVGFGGQSQFTSAFRRFTGLPPGAWRRTIMS